MEGEECCLLFGLHVLLSLVSYTTGDLLSRVSTTHSGLNSPLSIIDNNSLTELLTGQSDGGIVSNEVPLSHVDKNN